MFRDNRVIQPKEHYLLLVVVAKWEMKAIYNDLSFFSSFKIIDKTVVKLLDW